MSSGLLLLADSRSGVSVAGFVDGVGIYAARMVPADAGGRVRS